MTPPRVMKPVNPLPPTEALCPAAPITNNTIPTSTSLNAIHFDNDGYIHVDATAYQRHIMTNWQRTPASLPQQKFLHDQLIAKGIIAFQSTCGLSKNFLSFLEGITELDIQTLDILADYVTIKKTPENLTRSNMLRWIIKEATNTNRSYELLTMLAHSLFENEAIREIVDILHRHQPWLQKKYLMQVPENLRGKYQLHIQSNIQNNLTHKGQLELILGKKIKDIKKIAPTKIVKLQINGNTVPFVQIHKTHFHSNENILVGTLAKDTEFEVLGNRVTFKAHSRIWFYSNGMIRQSVLAKDVRLKTENGEDDLQASMILLFNHDGLITLTKDKDNQLRFYR